MRTVANAENQNKAVANESVSDTSEKGTTEKQDQQTSAAESTQDKIQEVFEAVKRGDLKAALVVLSAPLWLLALFEVVLTITDVVIAIIVVRFLPPEWLTWVPSELRELLGIADVPQPWQFRF